MRLVLPLAGGEPGEDRIEQRVGVGVVEVGERGENRIEVGDHRTIFIWD